MAFTMIIYVLLGILLFPLALVLYVPIASAYKGSSLVNHCLVSWYLRNGDETKGDDDGDETDDDRYICSKRVADTSRR